MVYIHPMQVQPDRRSRFRERTYEIIFGTETRSGKAFDVLLLLAIVGSVVAVALESVRGVRERFGPALRAAEWAFTVLFTAEYVLRLICVRHASRYARSFFGIIDLLAILPTYASLFFAGAQSLLVIRAIRLLRVFRIFKLAHFLGEAEVLRLALVASSRKILVFLGTVATLVVIIGAAIHLIEGRTNAGFSSIPQSIYWAIVTLTTVGYGDVAPQTVAGKMLASVVMIAGYGIIAVPTGIVTVELGRVGRHGRRDRACAGCSAREHDPDARHCKYCGTKL